MQLSFVVHFFFAINSDGITTTADLYQPPPQGQEDIIIVLPRLYDVNWSVSIPFWPQKIDSQKCTFILGMQFVYFLLLLRIARFSVRP